MRTHERDGESSLHAAILSLRPFEAFRLEADDETIVVACLGSETFGITCWFKGANLEVDIHEAFKARGLEVRLAAQNQQGRTSIATVVGGIDQGEAIISHLATLFNIPLKPGPNLPMVMSSPLDLG